MAHRSGPGPDSESGQAGGDAGSDAGAFRRAVANHPLWFALFAAVFALGLYVRTLAPDVVDADGGEFQFAAWNFATVHPTGYPLYLILGGLFQHLLPVGNPAYRLNLFTAVTAALAVGALYMASHALARRPGAALFAAASLAVVPLFWFDAVAAEVYDLHVAFVAMLVGLALYWQSRPSAARMSGFCLVLGLALCHHRMIILWLPGFALFFAMVGYKSWKAGWRPRDPARAAAVLVACLALPLLLYLYVPLRGPQSPYATLSLAPGRDLILYDNTLSGFVNYILGRVFQAELAWDGISQARLGAVPRLLLDQLGAVTAALGLGGLAILAWRRAWERLALILVSLVMNVLFAALYHIGDISHYYLPVLLTWVMLAGCAVGELGAALRRSRPAVGLLVVALAAVWLGQLVSRFPLADRSGDTQARRQWSEILSAAIPKNAILVSNDRDEMMPFWYLQYVENTRRDLIGLFPVITPAPEHKDIGRLIDSVIDAGRPLFLIKPMPGLEIKYKLTAADTPLVRVLGRAATTPPSQTSDAALGPRLRLIGYDWVRQADRMRVIVYWQPQANLERDYASFVHLVDARGDKVAQGNDHRPGGSFYPTSLWQIGETLIDEFTIPLPSEGLHGTYRLIAGMYTAGDLEPLAVPVEIGIVSLD